MSRAPRKRRLAVEGVVRMRRLVLLFAGLAVLASVVVASSGGATQVEARWVITELGRCGPTDDLGCIDASLMINEHGQIVGRSGKTAFLWENGTMRNLGTFGGPESDPYDINERGQIVGWADTKAKGAYGLHISRAFLWENGKMRSLGTFGGLESVAYDINDRGQIVGWAEGAYGLHHRAFLWQNGKMRDLGAGLDSKAVAINERGQVLIESGRGVLLWQNGKMRDLGLGPRVSDTRGLNERGQVLASTDDDDPDRLVLWANGKTRLITKEHTLGVALDKRGRVVGSFEDMKVRLFIWANGRTRLIGPGYFEAVNERGKIVGSRDIYDSRPLLWENGVRTSLPLLPGHKYGSALDLNERDLIVGWSGNVYLGEKDEVYRGRLVLWTLRRDT